MVLGDAFGGYVFFRSDRKDIAHPNYVELKISQKRGLSTNARIWRLIQIWSLKSIIFVTPDEFFRKRIKDKYDR